MIIFFFFNDTATTEIYTLSLHDALPISAAPTWSSSPRARAAGPAPERRRSWRGSRGRSARSPLESSRFRSRSEEHTSELQSRLHLVCRLLLEKKKIIASRHDIIW